MKRIIIRSNLIVSLLLILSSFSYTKAAIIVLNGLTHENQVQPGESYRGTIEIQNAGEDEKSVKVYLTDYWFSYTGESKLDSVGSVPRTNARWIKYNPDLLNLAANETATINYEVNVPDNDSLRGTYWSVIMVEGIETPDTTKQNKGVTINTSIRYAVQITTNIGETGTSDLRFLGLQLAKENNINILNVMIENTGERLLRPKLSLELFNESGTSVGVLKADPKKAYPGTSIKIVIPLEGINTGKYTGVLVADCDEDHIFGTNVSIEI